jgi:hypothetical protein
MARSSFERTSAQGGFQFMLTILELGSHLRISREFSSVFTRWIKPGVAGVEEALVWD